MPRSQTQFRGRLLLELALILGILAVLCVAGASQYRARETAATVSLAFQRMARVAPGLEAYYADFGTYPPYYEPVPNNFVLTLSSLLTSPVAYLANSSDLVDPYGVVPENEFGPAHLWQRFIYFDYANPNSKDFNFNAMWFISFQNMPEEWRMESQGPDMAFGPYRIVRTVGTFAVIYDPTNGTISGGQIVYNSDQNPPLVTGINVY